MKTPDWFVCLDYDGSIELLIPQKNVADYLSKNYSTTDLKICNIDNALHKIIPDINMENNCVSEAKILIHTNDFYLAVTRAHIEIKQIPLSEFSIMHGFLKEHLLKKGILAFRFADKKIQIIIDTDYFSRGGRRL